MKVSVCVAFRDSQTAERFAATAEAFDLYPKGEGDLVKGAGELVAIWFAPKDYDKQEDVWVYTTIPLLLSLDGAWCLCDEHGHGEIGRDTGELYKFAKEVTECSFTISS